MGVVGGLVFLGFEVQQNTTQLRTEASYSVSEALSKLNAAVYNDPVLADVLVRGEQDIALLDETELRQFSLYQFDRINLAQHIEVLKQAGVTDIHFPYVDFLEKDFHSKAGLQQFLVLVDEEWEGSRELYNRFLLDHE